MRHYSFEPSTFVCRASAAASPQSDSGTQSSASPPNKGANKQRKKGKSPEKGTPGHAAGKGAQKPEAGTAAKADVAGLAYGTHTPSTDSIPAPVELLNR